MKTSLIGEQVMHCGAGQLIRIALSTALVARI